MIPAAMSIFVATSAIDMRRAFDGLAEAARSVGRRHRAPTAAGRS